MKPLIANEVAMFSHLRRIMKETVTALDGLLYPVSKAEEPPPADAGRALWENLEAYEKGEALPNNWLK